MGVNYECARQIYCYISLQIILRDSLRVRVTLKREPLNINICDPSQKSIWRHEYPMNFNIVELPALKEAHVEVHEAILLKL